MPYASSYPMAELNKRVRLLETTSLFPVKMESDNQSSNQDNQSRTDGKSDAASMSTQDNASTTFSI